MLDWIRSYFSKRTRLRKLRVEHARSVAHRCALVRLGKSSNAALVLALQQIDLQIAAVEHDIRLIGSRAADHADDRKKHVGAVTTGW